MRCRPIQTKAMMTMRPEAKLEKYFIGKAEANGFIQYKFISGVTGVPDRILIGNNKIVFVELKAVNGRLSDRQKFVGNMLRKNGAKVFVPYDEKDIDDIFKFMKQEKTASI